MFFRFGSAIVLVVLIALVGTALEKRNLSLRRSVIRQHYRMEVLRSAHAKLRLETQQLSSPVRMVDSLENGALQLREPAKPVDAKPRQSLLLRWQRSAPLD